jgi:hypothetical protein
LLLSLIPSLYFSTQISLSLHLSNYSATKSHNICILSLAPHHIFLSLILLSRSLCVEITACGLRHVFSFLFFFFFFYFLCLCIVSLANCFSFCCFVSDLRDGLCFLLWVTNGHCCFLGYSSLCCLRY